MKEVPDFEKMNGKSIARLSHKDIYEWVKTGNLSRPHFDMWVEELMVQCVGEGYEQALEENQDDGE